MFEIRKKRRFWPYVLLVFFIFLFFSGIYLYNFVVNFDPVSFASHPSVQKEIKKRIGSENVGAFELAPYLLGFEKPKTILVLFLNNTELRPGGGFIGTYAVIEMNKGKTRVLKLEGTESIDNAADKSLLPEPLPIMKEQLLVDRWFFRDSNWSPDFSESSKKALELYRLENGLAANKIDAVVGITTDVLEELLLLTGPVSVQEIEFNSENVTEKLEYEVEYAYKERGISFADRKRIIEPFMHEVLNRLAKKGIYNMKKYFSVLEKLASEKQILFYSPDQELHEIAKKIGWTNEIEEVDGDYLMWIDANLAALKTDHALERDLSYTIENKNEEYLAKAKMQYTHSGSFDWRTSRYRSYTRLFVPNGAKLNSIIFDNGDTLKEFDMEDVDLGQELGKQWFGVFISIEPGERVSLEFNYSLPETVIYSNGSLYKLFVQKQAGTKNPGLTLGLNFDKNILQTEPVESDHKSDNSYSYQTDLRIDREFSIKFKE